MAGQKFDEKSFNPEAFGSYYETLPQPNKNELVKSRVLVANPKIKSLLSVQTGSYYGTIPFYGRIDGEALNYDGQTDITATSTDTYEQSVIAIGRAKAWMEKDFSKDITGGVDFMSQVAMQVAEYWNDIDTGVIMSIIKGIFSMTGTGNADFVAKHTHDISAEGEGVMKPTTLNVAMQKACEAQPSTMAAIIALADDKVEEICDQVTAEGEVCVAANFNCPGQIVISGSIAGIDKACELMKAAGAKRALPLKVGGAFHSPLMDPAKVELEAAINATEFHTPKCPIYQNVDALPHTDPAEIKQNLVAQLTASVRWTQTVQNMIADGADEFTECGPGAVLQGLIKKIDKNANAHGIE